MSSTRFKSIKPNTKSSASSTYNRAMKKSKHEPKVSAWVDDYLDLSCMRMTPMTEAGIERLAEDLNQWSQKETSLVFRDFYDEKQIPHKTFGLWCERFPVLQDAASTARGRIGSRREKGAIVKKFDGSIVSFSMPIYDPEWKEFVKWKAEIKAKNEESQKLIIEINDLAKKTDTKIVE